MSLEKRFAVKLPETLVRKLDQYPGSRATHVFAAVVQYIDQAERVMQLCDPESQNPADTTMPKVSDSDVTSREARTVESQSEPPEGAGGQPSEPRARVVKRYPPSATTMPKDRDVGDELNDVLGDWT